MLHLASTTPKAPTAHSNMVCIESTPRLQVDREQLHSSNLARGGAQVTNRAPQTTLCEPALLQQHRLGNDARPQVGLS
jgi:hypothetical protein